MRAGRLCLFLRRTGNLWLPIGFHTAFNWAQIYFYGVATSGVTMPGHLLQSSFSGPAPLSGGMVGPEGSWLCTLLFAGIALVFAATFRRRRAQDLMPSETSGHDGSSGSR